MANPDEESVLDTLKKDAGEALEADLLESDKEAGLSQVFLIYGGLLCMLVWGHSWAGRLCRSACVRTEACNLMGTCVLLYLRHTALEATPLRWMPTRRCFQMSCWLARELGKNIIFTHLPICFQAYL